MVERKRRKKSSKKAKNKGLRKEHRFEPERTRSSRLSVGAGMLGALVLGAGVYGRWFVDNPIEFAPFIIAIGGTVLFLALLFDGTRAPPIRIGDPGVAQEKSDEISRLPWCDIDHIRVERDQLLVEGDELALRIPLEAHREAVAKLLSEAVRRIPDAMDVKQSIMDRLPDPKKATGELVPIDSLQIAGRHCAASGKAITFEREARLCKRCAEVYHQNHVPKECVSCGQTLTDNTLTI